MDGDAMYRMVIDRGMLEEYWGAGLRNQLTSKMG